jgi:hypothetical protein
VHHRRRDSAVGMATGYRLDGRGFGFRALVGSRIFSSPRRPDRLWGPPSLLSNGVPGALSQGAKQQGREADHSPPTSAEVKKTWSYTSTPTVSFNGVVLNWLSTRTSLPFYGMHPVVCRDIANGAVYTTIISTNVNKNKSTLMYRHSFNLLRCSALFPPSRIHHHEYLQFNSRTRTEFLKVLLMMTS